MDTTPSPHPLTRIGLPPSGEAEPSYPAEDRRITGQPLRETWSQVDTPLHGAQRFYSGLWRSQVGHWRIAMGPTEQEVFTVLEGRCRVHSDAGGFQEAGAGQAIHIPAGFTGSFEVLEPLSKVYVIVE